MELVDRPYIKRVSILGGDPLAAENLSGTLDLVQKIHKKFNTPQDMENEIQDIAGNDSETTTYCGENANKRRILFPKKTIWLYTGYTWEQIYNNGVYLGKNADGLLRRNIVKMCDVLVDGEYIDSKRDITLKWRGSSNQRVIDVKKSLSQEKPVLYCD